MRLTRYVGNTNAYAVQQLDGGYRPVRAPLTNEVLESHLRGEQTIGTYLMDMDKARSIVFDDDNGDLAIAQALASTCKRKGLSAGVEFSGRKGYHVWVLFAEWETAADVRRIAKSVAAEVGFTGEVFPKQDAARDLGNLVKLPFGLHRVTGQRSRFVGPEPSLNAHGTFARVLAEVPADVNQRNGSVPQGPTQFPCLESIQTMPPREGERNILGFHFACHLRRLGLLDEAIRAALATVVDPDSLDPGEFDSIVEHSEFSGPICDSISPDRHCPEDACLKSRSVRWLAQRPGQLRHAAEGEPVVFVTLKHTESVVELSHPDATIVKAALRGQRED